MTLTRRGLFGLIGAAAAGKLVPSTPVLPIEPPTHTVKLIIDGKELARQVIRHLPKELQYMGLK